MGRVAIAVFILVFWLAWPVIPTMLSVSTGVGADFDKSLGDAKDSLASANPADSIGSAWDTASIYLQFLTFTIPDMPLAMRFIGWILTGLGVLTLAFFIRG